VHRLFLIALIGLVFFPTQALAEYPTDEKFLAKIERNTFDYFLKEQDQRSGLIRDSSIPGAPSSIAACGFGMAAFCIGAERGWIEKGEAYKRISLLLESAKEKMENVHGFFYHFVDMETGKRAWSSEISSIDTAIFLAGALLSAEYFKGTEVESAARALYNRVDWPWMLDGKGCMRMGYKPNNGFLQCSWDFYSEHILLLALAIGSPSHPIPKESWDAWQRESSKYASYEFVHSFSGGIFTYQYPHAFIDFRAIAERGDGIDYWENSKNAILANRQFCIDNSKLFKTYGEDSWGLTASTGPNGYKDYGAIPGRGLHDGTVAPSAACGSVPFAPQEAVRALRFMYDVYGDRIYGRYGFADSFNLDKNWFSREYLGISQGISLLMLENYNSRFVWKNFMKSEPIQRWVALCMKEKK